MMQSFAMMAVITILWALVSYSLAFGSGSSFIGGLHHLLLRGVGAQPDADYAATIPLQTFMVYQFMFAIITPALITGAFAERMKFSAMLAVHDPVVADCLQSHGAHGVGQGRTAQRVARRAFPCLDFAGGTVVHVTSGVSALVCALYLGKRVGYPKEAMPPHSVVLSFMGACLLWVGWFGFNAGSALAAGSLATSAFVATHFGAAAAALGWSGGRMDSQRQAQRFRRDLGGCCRTGRHHARCGFRWPYGRDRHRPDGRSVLLLDGVSVKARFGYDDCLDAFGVHGAGGTLGALLTGVFAASAINPIFKDDREIRFRPACSTAMRISCSTRPWASSSPGSWRSWVR